MVSSVTHLGNVSSSIGSALWAPPDSPDSNNEEFTGSFDTSKWAGAKHEFTQTAVGANISVGTVDAYDTGFTTGDPIRVLQDDPIRPSWLQMQVIAGPELETYSISKPYTVPTNVVILARFKFNLKAGIASNDGDIALMLGPTSGSVIDRNNSIEIFMNETDPTVVQSQATFDENTPLGTTDDVDRIGSKFAYAAIHKMSDTYWLYSGSDTGNFIAVGTTVQASLSHNRVGLQFGNTTTNAPGVSVVGCDFIRFFPGLTSFPF